MSVPLLSTKRFVPLPRADIICRPRLFDKINQGLQHAFVLISAPAGFGKTTLLSTWVFQNPLPTAWLSIDPGDNDPARYLAYIIASLQAIFPNLGNEILENLQSHQPDFSEGTLISLINEINAMDRDDFVLILDDYHLITSSGVHAITNFFLDHMPASMHLVIATRADPDIPLPRFRGRGELVEIRQDDLRFTTAEMTALCRQTRDLELTPEDIEALIERTEGWVAGLQLALLSMSGKTDIRQFIKDFTGSDRFILDYLMDEVFKGQPSEIQDFLLKTSLVSQLKASLCNTLTGGENSQAILERLDRANLFIVPLDNERNWYRYHHLFADLLKKRLGDIHPEIIPYLHRQASKWYASNRFIPDAVQHALAAQEYRTAAELITQIAETILMQSESALFLNWLQVIPDEIILENSVLSPYYAYALFLHGFPLQTIEAFCGTLETATDQNKGYIAAVRSLLAVVKRDIPVAAKLTQFALKHLPEDDRFFRPLAFWVRSAADLVSGNFEGGFQTLEEVARQSRAVGNMMGYTMAACNQGKLHVYRGELAKAEYLYRQVMTFAKTREGQPLPIAGEAFFGMGELYYEWNEMDVALETIDQGLALTQNWGTIGSVDGLVSKSKIYRARGEFQTAHEILLKAHALALDSEAIVQDDYETIAHIADLWLVQGNLSAALNWMVERELGELGADGQVIIAETPLALDQVLDGTITNIRNRQAIDFYTLVNILIFKAQYRDALELLNRLLKYAHQRELSGRVILVRAIMALVKSRQGDQRAALEALKIALDLAEPEGYVRVFLDRGLGMQKLLVQATQHQIAPAYVNRLLAGFDDGQSKPSSKEQALVDSLSNREMDVLRMLPTKLTAPEIADQLYIAESTVRTHIKRIYAKLNVNRRFDAVERARALGLL